MRTRRRGRFAERAARPRVRNGGQTYATPVAHDVCRRRYPVEGGARAVELGDDEEDEGARVLVGAAEHHRAHHFGSRGQLLAQQALAAVHQLVPRVRAHAEVRRAKCSQLQQVQQRHPAQAALQEVHARDAADGARHRADDGVQPELAHPAHGPVAESRLGALLEDVGELDAGARSAADAASVAPLLLGAVALGGQEPDEQGVVDKRGEVQQHGARDDGSRPVPPHAEGEQVGGQRDHLIDTHFAEKLEDEALPEGSHQRDRIAHQPGQKAKELVGLVVGRQRPGAGRCSNRDNVAGWPALPSGGRRSRHVHRWHSASSLRSVPRNHGTAATYPRIARVRPSGEWRGRAYGEAYAPTSSAGMPTRATLNGCARSRAQSGGGERCHRDWGCLRSARKL
eukprot:scaffold1584_cov363-Prasinococcus_capsulatus_cf.AAC.1